MIISVIGVTDKRPVIYGLLKLLEPLGDIAVISNNMYFRRLINDAENPDHVKNIFMAVTDMTPEEVWSEVQLSEDKFDFVIYDSIDNLPDKADIYIHVKGSTVEDAADTKLLDTLPEDATLELIKLCYDGKDDGKNSDYHQVMLGGEIFPFIEVFESKHLLNGITNKALVSVLSTIMEEPTGVSAKKLTNIMRGGNR